MRFFTFFVIACTTFISTNAVDTEDFDSTKAKTTEKCSTALNGSVKSVSLSQSKLGSSNLEPVDDITADAIIKIIQNEKANLAAGFQNVPLMCCQAGSSGPSVSSISYDDIGALVTAYSEYLISFKSKKVSLSKNPKVLNVVKDLLETIRSDLDNFVNCVRESVLDPEDRLALDGLGASFYRIADEVIDYVTA